jgi:adenosylcobinamide-GDP ribazoletransferase
MLTPLRLAVGTLTVLPVGALPTIGPRAAGRAMLLAPLATIPLAAAAAAAGWVATLLALPAAVVGLLVVAALALGTRALHLDGLADTADGLGSGWDPERALTVMKRGDVGPMGVVALLVVLGLQAAGFAVLVVDLTGAATAGLLICISRAALVLVCRRGVRAARPTGLGVVMAGTVAPGVAAVVWLLVLVATGLATDPAWVGSVTAALAGLVVLALVRHCVRRFGGVTGDVMGAAVELTLTILVLGAVVRG